MLIHASAAPQIFRNWVGWRQEIMWKGSGRVGTWGTAIAIKDAQIANARLVLLIDSAPVSQLRPSMRDQRSPAVACPCPAAICAACHLRGRRGGRTGSGPRGGEGGRRYWAHRKMRRESAVKIGREQCRARECTD